MFVVRGVDLALGPASTPTRSWRAAGLEVKKDKSRLFSVAAEPFSLAVSTFDRIERSCEMTASFRPHSSLKARFSFFVSSNFLRCVWMDSGVGVSCEELKERPYHKAH